jgi:hypothetical protein
VTIRPHLLGLTWARGAEPTPHGLLRVAIRSDHGYVTTIHLPPMVTARVSLPVRSGHAVVRVNGRAMISHATDGGRRDVVTLRGQGRYVVALQFSTQP